MPRNVHTNSAPTPDKAKAEQSNAHILDLIGQVSKSYGHAQDMAQECGVAIMVHAMTYGDCSKASALCRAIPARERRSIVGWFAFYSPIEVTMGRKEEADKVRLRKATDKGYKPFDVEGATKTHWTTDPMGLNPEPNPIDFADFEQQMESRFKKALEAAKAEDDSRFIPTARAEIIEFSSAVLDFIGEYNKRLEAKRAGSHKAPDAKADDEKPETAKTA